MTNIEIFLVEKEIVESLRNKETSKCFAWCNENKSKLKKINVCLNYYLMGETCHWDNFELQLNVLK